MEHHTRTVTQEELPALAEEVLALCVRTHAPERASLIACVGDLGAGKTAFTQALARCLGVEQTVTSPTFVIERRYRIHRATPWNTLVHIDAYRIEDTEELAGLRFSETIKDPKAFVVIEWPAMLKEALPEPDCTVFFAVRDETTRTVSLTSTAPSEQVE